MKKTICIILILIVLILAVTAGLLIRLRIRTDRILNDCASIYGAEKYRTPVYAEGVEVITQDVSCGYACIEMFSAWNGGDLTEEDLYAEYGKVVTSTGDRFCEEMNRRFPEYTTTIHKYLTNTEAKHVFCVGIHLPRTSARDGGNIVIISQLMLDCGIEQSRKLSAFFPFQPVKSMVR